VQIAKQHSVVGDGTTVVPTAADVAGVVATGEMPLARKIKGANLKVVDGGVRTPV
jgi:hypothetical protein